MKNLFTEEDGIKTITFGTGEVGVSSGFLDDVEENIGILAFKPQESVPIGYQPDFHPDGECYTPTHEMGAELQFYFTKTSSIDVVIGKLMEVKKLMEVE